MNARGIAVALAGFGCCPGIFAQSDGTAWVRHAPVLNGRLEGSVRVMAAEDLVLNGGAVVTGDLLVPGTPQVRLNGHPSFAGVIEGHGAPGPAGYQILINGGAALRHVVRRTDPIALPAFDAPPPPPGTRSVSLSQRGQSPGDFGTLRNLTLNGWTGLVPVPPGTYGIFVANAGGGFVLGTAGSGAPAVYNFQSLTLNGGGALAVLGPVVVTVAGNVVINADADVGAPASPDWLDLRVAGGGVTVNGRASVSAALAAPRGAVTLNGGGEFIGRLACDRLTLNGAARLRLTAPYANLPPTAALISPGNGATFVAPAAVPLRAQAADCDGSIAKVVFFAGATRIGEALAAPYDLLWSGVPAGAYALAAVAVDDAGATGRSAVVNITVVAPANQPPTVALTSPAEGAAFSTPAVIHLEAAASDPDGRVVRVEYFFGPTRIGEAAAPPFACEWAGVAPGAYAVTAKATDDAGATGVSGPVTVRVATGMPFAADFESAEGYARGPLDGQGGWTCNGAALVTDADAEFGGQSVLVPGRSPAVVAGHVFPAAIGPAVTFVDFCALLAAGPDPAGGSGWASDAAMLALVHADGSGVLQVFDGDGWGGGAWRPTPGRVFLDGAGLAADWHRVTIRSDYLAKKWDVYLDGVLVAADAGFRDRSRAAFSEFAFTGHPTAATLLDSVSAGFDNPLFADADWDGMPDTWETACGLDPAVDDRGGDRDGDGLTNLREYLLGTRPDLADTDGDGLPDGWEAAHHLDPLQASAPDSDLDNDALRDREEYASGTDPEKADTDGDGMPDGWEVANGLNPLVDDAAGDSDGDGIANLQECRAGTNPTDYYNGDLPALTALVPEGQLNADNSLTVSVTDAAGRPLANAPVTFTVIEGDHRLAPAPDGPGVAELVVRADTDGVARVFVKAEGG